LVSTVFSSLPARPKHVRARHRGLLYSVARFGRRAVAGRGGRRRLYDPLVRVPERNAEVLADVDVVIAGGGPAGLASRDGLPVADVDGDELQTCLAKQGAVLP